MSFVTISVDDDHVSIDGVPIGSAAELRTRLSAPAITEDAARLTAAAMHLPDSAATEDTEAPEPPPVADFGHRLYEALLPTGGMRQTVGDGRCLALDLPLDIAGLPWELMHDGTDLLALTQGIVRVIGSKATIPTEPNAGLLAALAAPVLSGPIDVREHATMLHAVAASCPVPITIRRHVTREVLRETLPKAQAGITFIVAHGSQECIALERRDWTSDRVSARELARWLTRRGVWMVMLNSCLTASEADHVQAFAGDLVAAGVPIAIGMQYPVALTATRAFSEAVLRRVAEGADVIDILVDGREAVKDSDEPAVEPWDFATPVLFLSSELVGSGDVVLPALAAGPVGGPNDPDGAAVQDLPRPPDRFIGRRLELQDIGRALARRSLTVLFGTRGVGKTALVREAAGRAAKDFTRIVWVSEQVHEVDEELETVRTGGMMAGRPASEMDVITRLADELGPEDLAPDLDFDDRLRECLRRAGKGHPLIVLDNLDSIIDEPYMQQLLVNLPANCRVLATCFRRPTGALPTVQVQDLPIEDAGRLAHAEARRLSLRLSDHEVRLLLNKVGGHPLGIRLVLARAARSDKVLERLLAELPEERSRLIPYMLEEFERLEEPAPRRLLAIASAFSLSIPTSVLREAADLPYEEFTKAYGLLTDLALVEPFPAKEVRVPELIRLRLLEQAEAMTLAELAGAVLRVRASVETATLCMAASELESRCRGKGEVKTWMALGEAALDRARGEGNPFLVALGASDMAIALLLTGDPETALRLFEEARRIREGVGDESGQAMCLGNMGLIYADQGKPEEALAKYQQAYEIDVRLGNPQGQAEDLGNMGNIYADQGKPEEALAKYQQAYEIAERLGNPQTMASSLGNMGLIYADQGKPEEALACQQQAYEMGERLGNPELMGNALGNIGLMHLREGNMAGARESLERALELYDRHGYRTQGREIVAEALHELDELDRFLAEKPAEEEG